MELSHRNSSSTITMIHSNSGSLRAALAIVFAQLLVMRCLFAGESLTNDSLKIVDSLRSSEALFQAGEYRKAEELFRAELAIPEIPIGGGCPVGWTPKSVRVRIWLARCHGRLGQKEVALKECIQVAREAKDKWEWWNKDDRERLAKTLVENAQTPEQSLEVERFAKIQDFKELREYFDAISLVKNGDAAGVVKYLTRNDMPVSPVDPALWSDEIAGSAAALKPAMIRYVREQLERAARWQDTDFSLYHLDHLLRVLPDESFVEPCLGSRQLERRFPDAYRRWRNMLQIYPKECKKAAILHLKGDRDSKELALDLINALQLYDREILDQIGVVALENCYPIQIRSLLAFWRVSGQQFGLEAETTDLALQQASNDTLRTALSQALEWWKRQRAGLAGTAQIPVQTTNKDVLERGLRCRVEMIRTEAIRQLGKSKQSSGNPPNKAHGYIE